MTRGYFWALCVGIALFLPLGSCAQSNTKLPEEVAEIFQEADASVRLGEPTAPIVALPEADTEKMLEIVRAGGVPIALGGGINDFNMLRDLAASLDGFILSDSFARHLDERISDPDGSSTNPERNADILLLKAIVDRNVPIYGSSELLRQINTEQKRFNESYSSIEEFVAAAATFKKAKSLMQRILTIDTHNDEPCEYRHGASIGLRQKEIQCSLPKMEEGLVDAAFVVAYQGQGELDEESSAAAVRRCDNIIDQIYADAAQYSDHCGIARTEAEVRKLKAAGKKAIFIGIENGYGIGTNLANIKHFRDRGVSYITLCHTGDNAICHTASSKSADSSLGLTPFGKEVIQEMNDCGMLIDVSHASDATFWDVYRESRAPFVCTHSGARAVFSYNRNITDEMLRAIAEKNGTIQVYFVDNFICWDEKLATIDTMMEHLFHCIKVAGIDHVGIGTDFDGGGGGPGLNGDNDMVNITVRLINAGYSDEDIAKLWGGNFMRVLSEVQALATK